MIKNIKGKAPTNEEIWAAMPKEAKDRFTQNMVDNLHDMENQKRKNRTDMAVCYNEQCPSHGACLRYWLGQNGDECETSAPFAPKSKYAQKCQFFIKKGD